MKAIQISKPMEINLINQEDYNHPLEPKDVLLRIKMVGYCGSDLNTYRGLNPLVSYPRIPGHEIAAEIITLGSSVPNQFKEGQLVTVIPYSNCGECSACKKGRFNVCKNNQTLGVQREGALTEYLTIPYEKLITHPEITDLKKLVMIEPFAVGFHAVRRTTINKGDFVAVIGCGVIGIGTLLGAMKHSNNIIAIDIADEKLEKVKKLGIKYTINSQKENLEEKLLEITGGFGPDVIIEAVGSPTTFSQAVDYVCFAGSVVFIGYPINKVEFEGKYILMKELNIYGSRGAEPIDFEHVIQFFLEHKNININQLISSYPLEQGAQGMRDWYENPDKFIKIMIELS